MSALEIPDSLGWRAGTIHERERILLVLRTLREDLIAAAAFSPEQLRGARSALHLALAAIEDHP